MRSSPVLILSDDPLLAALVGVLADMLGHTPTFAGEGERPEEALARVRPVFVVLLDASLEAVASDLFFARAAQRRIGVAVLATGGRAALAGRARARGVPWFDVPADVNQMERVLEAAAGSEWWRPEPERRRAPSAERRKDGTMLFVDRAGGRWSVYDRRGGERRTPNDWPPPDDTSARFAQRVFVSEHGSTWQCPLRREDTGEPTADALERQLARAVRSEAV